MQCSIQGESRSLNEVKEWREKSKSNLDKFRRCLPTIATRWRLHPAGSAANRLLAGVMRDWDGLRPSAEDTSPATEASCAPANSLPLVTAGFHALTSNYGWESFRMEASPDWAQWTLNSIKAVMGIVYHGHGARPPPFRTSFLIFHLYYIARSILSTHCVFCSGAAF